MRDSQLVREVNPALGTTLAAIGGAGRLRRWPVSTVGSSSGAAVEDAPRSSSTAIFMYMKSTVGVAELRQNLSRYLRRVEQGERLVVTDRNRPVAELGPPPTTGDALDRVIAEGRVSRPRRRGLPEPIQLEGDPHALSRALDEIRGER